MDKKLIEAINVEGVNVTAEAIDTFEKLFSEGIGKSTETDRLAVAALFIQLGAYAISGIEIDEGETIDDVFKEGREIRRINRKLRSMRGNG